MAVHAGMLRHSAVPRLDLNGLMKVFKRKCQRMEEPIVGLGHPFADKAVRKVAIVAYSDVTMARILPRIEMALHHVAISACRRVIAQIAPALAITERKCADTRENAEHHCKRQRECDGKT